ncbi:aminotransferase class V-fold PLP-dependent enzyme [Nocardia yunnanensis]|uniref:Aminotransferase class V-fold PLP-dependent enzyme n=1 Tax=Nocardia yunnanensis TaxID=2382165 RepID=A0A386Z9C6_9NOCA|nr:aminotransferase class V-fold PLP-dependent enzyme [Nocardia yunnanensis]AYF74261.1 aminotransferase class V-fold PLP-dependent enzyme [Nocardia yunnanensis]
MSPAPAFAALVRDEFVPTTTYLNAASYGLLPKSVVAAVVTAEEQRMRGEFDIPGVDAVIDECRAAFGRLTGFAATQVAVGSQVSQFVGLVAQSLPPGSGVLVPEHEFNSVLWPFLVRTDLDVRVVPLAELPDAVHPGIDLVAAAVVQSADGAVLDIAATVAAARAHGARVLFDVSQAVGWLPVHETGADWIVSVGYKWLLGPKGTAFLAGTPAALDELTPLAAGWYAGYNPWETCYDGPLRLAPDARRFDVGPVWPAWHGQRRSLDLLERVGIETIQRHDLALADRLRKGLGLPEGDSPVVSLAVSEAQLERARAAGIVGAMRAGRLRLACHLYNTEDDVDRALDALD